MTRSMENLRNNSATFRSSPVPSKASSIVSKVSSEIISSSAFNLRLSFLSNVPAIFGHLCTNRMESQTDYVKSARLLLLVYRISQDVRKVITILRRPEYVIRVKMNEFIKMMMRTMMMVPKGNWLPRFSAAPGVNSSWTSSRGCSCACSLAR